MSKVIPSELAIPRMDGVQPGEPVEAADWLTLNQALNYHYARTGAVVNGMTFRPPWETNLTSYTTDNNSGVDPGGQYDLDDWQGLFRFQRPIHNTGSGADAFNLRVNAYIQNLDVRFTAYDIGTQTGSPPTATSSGGISGGNVMLSSTSGDAEWVSGDLGLPISNTTWRLVVVEAKVPSAGTGYLWQFSMREYIDDVSELPRNV